MCVLTSVLLLEDSGTHAVEKFYTGDVRTSLLLLFSQHTHTHNNNQAFLSFTINQTGGYKLNQLYFIFFIKCIEKNVLVRKP